MQRVVSVCVLLLLLCGLCACGRGEVEGASFRFPLAAEPSSLDPQTAADEPARAVIEALFEGLCRMENGTPVPAAATWTVDGATYIFSLLEATWSDGTPVTADDFVFAYERTKALEAHAPQQAVFAEVQSVTAPDTRTLQVVLQQPDPSFLNRVATDGWYPCLRTFFHSCGGGYGMEPDRLVTNGAFTLSRWTHNEALWLQRSETYHRAAEIAPAAVRFVIGPADAAALENGTLHACPLTDTTGVANTQTVADTVQYLWFNTTVSPLTDTAVRTALRDAVEWERVTATLSGTPTASYVAPAATLEGEGYVSALSAPYTQPDRTAFANALAATGTTQPPAFTLLCGEDKDTLRAAQYILQSWQKHLGVYFSVEQVSDRELVNRLIAGNYHLAIAPATAAGAHPADALALFHGTAQTNWSRYENAAFVAACREADSLADWQAAEARLAADCPAVPLTVTPQAFGFAPGVGGVTVHPFTHRLSFRQGYIRK